MPRIQHTQILEKKKKKKKRKKSQQVLRWTQTSRNALSIIYSFWSFVITDPIREFSKNCMFSDEAYLAEIS